MSTAALLDALNAERLRPGRVWSWRELARRAKISENTLLNMRQGKPSQERTDTHLENLFGWPHGRIAAIRAGTYRPEPATAVHDRRRLLRDRIAELPPDRLAEVEAFVAFISTRSGDG